MNYISILLILNLVFTATARKSVRQRRTLIFPPTPCLGVFVAIAVPINTADKNVFVSYNFESNYALVSNITEFTEVLFPNLPIITSRRNQRLTREFAYTVLESKFNENGVNGRYCMLRNICETAETPLDHNGILGHLMHFIFTPSASREEDLDEEYYEAEAAGYRGDCDKYVQECPTSLFDYVTRLFQYTHNL